MKILISSVVLLLLRLPIISAQNSSSPQQCCHVVELDAIEEGGTWSFSASMSSPYEVQTGLSKYCDFFEVRTTSSMNYTVLGKRSFDHDHPYEQPFTRVIGDVTLPNGVNSVVAIAHDSVDGYCGRSLEVDLTARTPTSVTASPVVPSSTVSSAPIATSDNPMVLSSPAPITQSPMTSAPTVRVPNRGVTLSPVNFVPAPGSTLPSNIPSSLPSNIPSSLQSLIPSLVPSDVPSGMPDDSSSPVKSGTSTLYGI